MTSASHHGDVLRCDALVLQRGAVRALDGISLGFAAGQWTAVVGPNGAGKSSLLAALAGLLAPQAGRVWLRGRTLAEWPARERAQTLAWMSQAGEADGDIAVHEVVRLGRLPHLGLFGAPGPRDEAAVSAAMAETEVLALAGRRLSALSGGERQRVLLARTLAVGAPLLLLDEPTTHLDAPHQRTLLTGLAQRARAGATVISVLHDLTLALAADRVLLLVKGRVAADGAPADPVLRAALVEAFGAAFSIEAVEAAGVRRYVAVPRLPGPVVASAGHTANP